MNKEALLTRFENAKGKRAQYFLFQLENILTPQEYLDLRYRLGDSDHSSPNNMKNGPIAKDLLAAKQIQRFKRIELVAGGANLYSNGSIQREKRLLVCFTGKAKRLTMALPPFLQRIDAVQFDVLIFQDASMNHYRTGISGRIDTFNELVGIVEHLVWRRLYHDVYALGTSMGGLPAIRFGLLPWCNRAISFGGRPPDDTARLLRNQLPIPQPFDRLCDCLEKRQRNLFFVYSEHQTTDRRWAIEYARRSGGTALMLNGLETHAVLGELWGENKLDTFLKIILDPEFCEKREQGAWNWSPQQARLTSALVGEN